MNRLKERIKDWYRLWFFLFTNNVLVFFLSIVVVVSILDSIRQAWKSGNFLSSAFLWLITNLIYFPLLILPFGAGAWTGSKVHKSTKSSAAGWISGIVVTVLVLVATQEVISMIPGVNWRFRMLLNNSGTDY